MSPYSREGKQLAAQSKHTPTQSPFLHGACFGPSNSGNIPASPVQIALGRATQPVGFTLAELPMTSAAQPHRSLLNCSSLQTADGNTQAGLPRQPRVLDRLCPLALWQPLRSSAGNGTHVPVCSDCFHHAAVLAVLFN